MYCMNFYNFLKHFLKCFYTFLMFAVGQIVRCGIESTLIKYGIGLLTVEVKLQDQIHHKFIFCIIITDTPNSLGSQSASKVIVQLSK